VFIAPNGVVGPGPVRRYHRGRDRLLIVSFTTPGGAAAESQPRAPTRERNRMTSLETLPQTVELTLIEEIERLGVDRSDINREATFAELDIDSLDLVEIVQMVESTWAIGFDLQDFANVESVGAAIDLVSSRLSER
jgi:acyl carrier protein